MDGQTFSLPPAPSTYTVLLDTGTTLSYIPEDQFAVLLAALNATGQTEAVEANDGTVIYEVPCALALAEGGIDFEFSGPAGNLAIQVPWAELVLPIPDANNFCPFGVTTDTQADTRGVYILGDTFIRSAYLLYNFDASTISLAQASYDPSPGQVIEI